MRLMPLLAGLCCALWLSAPLSAQSSAVVTLVTAGRLLDPPTGKYLAPAAVLIENDKIS